MINPNPAQIADPMWKLWETCPIPGVKLSGIYANKKGYHNTVNANLRNWPDNYSIKLPLDLVPQNRSKARAIDLTMSDSEMVKWTTRMKNAFLDPNDTRLGAVKEFYGTLDNKTVYGLSKDSVSGRSRRVTSDSSHLWHGHTSIFTSFVNSWVMLAPLISVWRGETFAEWSLSGMSLPKKGDTGEEVRYWQNVHNTVAKTVDPPAPGITVDGIYGDDTAKAFAYFWHKKAATGVYDGSVLTGWLALQYNKALITHTAPLNPIVPPAQLEAIVTKWLVENVPKNLVIKGQIEGAVTIVGGTLTT